EADAFARCFGNPRVIAQREGNRRRMHIARETSDVTHGGALMTELLVRGAERKSRHTNFLGRGWWWREWGHAAAPSGAALRARWTRAVRPDPCWKRCRRARCFFARG